MPRYRLTVFVSAFFLLVFPGINHKALADEVTITISGPDASSDGDQYSVAGGTEPYTWSITKGSIDENGMVIVSGQCGTATITEADGLWANGYKGRDDVIRKLCSYSLSNRSDRTMRLYSDWWLLRCWIRLPLKKRICSSKMLMCSL